MSVLVKNMSGVFIFSTTPRKARLLLKENKAVIESKNPFTIRILYPASECGLKDSSEHPSRDNHSSPLPNPKLINFKKENTMCDNTKENINNSLDSNISTQLSLSFKEIEFINKDTDPRVIQNIITTPSLCLKHYNCLLTKLTVSDEEFQTYYSKNPILDYIYTDGYTKLQNLWLSDKPKTISVYLKEINVKKNSKDNTIKAEYTYLITWENNNDVENKQTLTFKIFNYHNFSKENKAINNDIGRLVIALLYAKIEYVDIHLYDMVKPSDESINSFSTEDLKEETRVLEGGLEKVLNNFKPDIIKSTPITHLFYTHHHVKELYTCFEQESYHKIQDGYKVLYVCCTDKEIISVSVFCDKIHEKSDLIGKALDPKEFAERIVFLAKESNKNLIVLHGSFLEDYNTDYLVEEYFRELSIVCKKNNLSLYFSYISGRCGYQNKPLISQIFYKFSDYVTFCDPRNID